MPPDRDDIAWLFTRQRFGVRPGLERTRALLAAAGDPQDAFASVLVGGTNGKGSTVATLASALTAGGRRVGRFVSPDLGDLTERIVVGGRRIGRELLAEEVARFRPTAERVGATFFEVLFAASCSHFAASGVEVATMEIGLGGRYDSGNALAAERSILTGVALDHTALLGDTIAEIARDKAAIFRPGRSAFTGATGEALAIFDAEARRLGTPLHALGRELGIEGPSVGWDGVAFTLREREGALALSSPLLGRHQLANVALAAATARSLGVPAEAVAEGVATTVWPGRLERLRWRGLTLLLDGAHNPAAAGALAQALTELGAPPLTLILGVSADKDVAGIVTALAPLAERVIATRAQFSGRALDPGELGERIGADRVAADPEAALAVAHELAPEGTVLVAGSLFLVGEVRTLALGGRPEGPPRWQ
jgi:dihydrofolate synthase/folylpolyglutamate synthase